MWRVFVVALSVVALCGALPLDVAEFQKPLVEADAPAAGTTQEKGNAAVADVQATQKTQQPAPAAKAAAPNKDAALEVGAFRELPVQDNTPIDLVKQMSLSNNAPTDLEVSGINGRIFDDQKEKQEFEKRKHEMNQLVAKSIKQEDRIKSCVGRCGEGMRLFTVWTTPAESWNNKYTHSIDSALFHHPKAKVSIYSSSIPSDFLQEWKELGYDVSVERLNMKERAAGTPLESWANNLEKWHDGPFYYAHLSDAARLLVLYKEGGVYFDTDVVFVNSMSEVKNAVGWERPDSLCNALMAFEPKNSYLEEVLREFNDHYVMDDWAGNGPVLLTKVYDGKFKSSDQIHALEKAAFYLISWDEVHRFFEKQSPRDVDRDLQILKQKSFVVHFWNSRSHDLVVDPQSLMARMFTSYCVHCNPIHHKSLGTK